MSNPDTTETEAWSPMEVISKEEVTSKTDIFVFGLVVYEMHSPHVEKLIVLDDDVEDGDVDDSMNEEAFRVAGTRPPLPDSVQLDQSYRTSWRSSQLPMRILRRGLLLRRYLPL